MKETRFIQQNKEKWKLFEKILESGGDKENPEALHRLYVEITDDLSYSRTFYPNRSVRVYLNNLAQQIFFRIHKAKSLHLSGLLNFWKEDLPLLAYQSRKQLAVSAIIFLLSMLIGVVSSYMDDSFPTVILGEDYIEMTVENINSGDPMAVYKDEEAFGMSLGITGNNLFVALLTFVMGVLLGIGTIGVLIQNGIMVGAFQFFFYKYGLLQESALTIWMHGALEISSIVIAGAAGLLLGRGLVFPGTYTRLQSFQLSARQGLKLMLGIAPIIIIAGFIEGFFTRYTEVPDLIRLSFILFCFGFMFFYFVWYPWYLVKKKGLVPENKVHISFSNQEVFLKDRLYSAGELFTRGFSFYKKLASKIFIWAFLGSIAFCLLVFYFNPEEPSTYFWYSENVFYIFDLLLQFIDNEYIIYLPLINTAIFSLITYWSLLHFLKTYESEDRQRIGILGWIAILFGNLAIQVLFSWNTSILRLVIIPISYAFFLTLIYVQIVEKTNIALAIGRTVSLVFNSFWRVMGLFLLNLSILVLFLMASNSFITLFFWKYIGWNVVFSDEYVENFVILRTFFSSLLIFQLFPLILIGACMQYYSLLEIKEAKGLSASLKYFAQNNRLQGLEKER